jgi:hypothetical protein
MFTLYPLSYLCLHFIPEGIFEGFSQKNVTFHAHDLVSIQINVFDGWMVFFLPTLDIL